MKDLTQEIIELIWDSESYYMVAAMDQAPDRKELVDFAAEYGVCLPEEYLVHGSNELGGLYIEVVEELWPRAHGGDVGPFWSFLYGLFTYAFNDEAPEWMQLKVAAEEFKSMGHEVLPCLKVMGDADVYCFDKGGEIVKWDHNLDSFEPFDGNFFDLLRYETLELDDRRKLKAEQLAKRKKS